MVMGMDLWFIEVCVRLYMTTSVQSSLPKSRVVKKVGEGSTKPPGFTIPHYFYIYYISSHDFGAIQTTRVDIYTFTTETPYKISSRTHLPPSLRTGKFTVECPCPEAFRPYLTFSNTKYFDQPTPALPKAMTDDGMLFVCRALKKYPLRLKMSCDYTWQRYLMYDTMHTIIRTQNDGL
jgi:hypothetical protein